MRPRLTSVDPNCFHDTQVQQALCKACGTVQAFTLDNFPDSGLWTECRACQGWSYFFRILNGKIVNTSYEGTHMKIPGVPDNKAYDKQYRDGFREGFKYLREYLMRRYPNIDTESEG